MCRLLAREQLEPVGKGGLEDREAVAAAAGRAGQVDDERRATHAGDPAREEAVRRARDRVGADRLGDPGRGALEVGDGKVTVTAAVETTAQTGVEMEALTGASVAALTVYDMAKAIDKGMVVEELRLLEKTKTPA